MGKNAAMLTQDGKLTDIGSWYLGGAATNNIPQGSAASSVASFGSSAYVLGLAAVVVCLGLV